MEPTLYDGDRLLVNHAGKPRIGRLAIVRLSDGVVSVKRVVHREPDGWWVERDNPDHGRDSWTLGVVPDSDVIAVALLRVWPWRRPRREL